MILGTNDNNLQYGVDVMRLMKEKLLDEVYIYQFDFGATKGPGYDGVDVHTWAIQSRLGHIDEIRWRQKNLEAEKPARNFRFFKWWGTQRMDVRFAPYWGG
jgi:hypothetical protein